jgi:hypothetical protein
VLPDPRIRLRGTVLLQDQEIRLKLTRSHGGAGDQPVRVMVEDRSTEGHVIWRRYPTSDAWQDIPMVRRDEVLEAALPHQPPAGKLEYQVRLKKDHAEAIFPTRTAITRFKGDVHAGLLIPHIVTIFGAMLLSTRAGLAALAREPLSRLVWLTAALLLLGGFVFGPAVQKMAFGAWWTGFPFGHDLTDNKVLVAGLAWGWALWRIRGTRNARGAVMCAAIVTLVVFAIPHSVWGSELKWDELATTGS